MEIISLQLKIKDFYGELHTFTNHEYCILKITIKNFFKKLEKYGIRLLN